MGKEIISMISTLMTPFCLIVPLMFGKYYKAGGELSVWRVIFLCKIVDYVSSYVLIKNYEEGTWFTVLYTLSALYSTLYGNVAFVNMGAFSNRISDSSNGGTFLTFLASSSNLGSLWGSSLSLYALTYINYDYLVLAGLIYSLIFYTYFIKLIHIQQLPKHSFSLDFI